MEEDYTVGFMYPEYAIHPYKKEKEVLNKTILVPQDSKLPIKEVNVNIGSYEGMAKILNCDYVERVRIGNWKTRKLFTAPNDVAVFMYVDETGRYKEENTVNERASTLYGFPIHGETIVGDALLVAENNDNYDDLRLLDMPEEFSPIFWTVAIHLLQVKE